MPVSQDPPIAIVGGGIAGLACAHELTAAGLAAEIFDKARAPGGRVCTRYTEFTETFDHGAQFMTARDPSFQALLGHAAENDVIFDFSGEVQRLKRQPYPLWIGQPTMSGFAQFLAAGIPAHCQARVERLVRRDEAWFLELADGQHCGPYLAVVVAIPAPQAVILLEAVAPELAQQAARAEMAPCWTVMATWDAPLALPFGACESDHPVLAWAAHEARKPGRGPLECWVLQASAAWSLTHLEHPVEDVIPKVLRAFSELAQQSFPSPLRAKAHRWRYARVTTAVGTDSLFDAQRAILACGDWCRGNRVEDAWLSGRHAAQKLTAHLSVKGP